jgi:HlyD family secretion protein
MKSFLVLLSVVLVGGGGTYLVRTVSNGSSHSGVPGEALFTVERGKLTITITENGSLMAKNSEKISFMGRRGGKVTYLVEEGKTVEEDEVLCKLDTTDLEQRVQDSELEIVKTDADLNSAKTELEIQKSESKAAIEKAKIALDKAKNELEKYRDGDAPKERRKLEIAIKEAKTNYSRAKKKYEDSVKLHEQTFINQSQLEQDQIEFERSEIQLAGAERDLELFDKYTLPMTMVDKETAVKDAQRDLDNAGKRAESDVRKKEVAVEGYDQRLKHIKKNLDELKEELEKFTIKSPSPGIVIYGDPTQPWYRENIKIGSQIWGGFTMFTIPDLRVMQVQVQVHEADINKIKEGQVATITMDTYPGLVLKGKVSKIASIAGEPGRSVNAEVKKFTVDIVIDSTKGHTLKPGISAKAEIFVDEREDVLYVPLQCVFIEEGQHYCYVMRDGDEPVRVAVKPELSNDTYLQIVEGLKEGDRVLLYNPTLRAKLDALGEAPGAAAPPPAETAAQP